MEEGFAEVRELLASRAPGEPAATDAGTGQPAAAAPAGQLTVGSLLRAPKP